MEPKKVIGSLASSAKKYAGKHAIAIGSAVVISVGGVGGIAYALTSGSSPANPGATAPSPSAAAPSPSTAGATGTSGSANPSSTSTPTPTRRSKIRSLIGRAVRAQVVVGQAGGGFETLDLYRGTASSVSATSITVEPLDNSAPVTAAITSSTHEPKNATISQGERVLLVSSDGDALIVRPMRTSAGASAGTPAPSSSSGSTSST